MNTQGINLDTAVTLREILLKNVPLEKTVEGIQELFESESSLQVPETIAHRAAHAISNASEIDDTEVITELTEYFKAVVEDRKHISKLKSRASTLSEYSGVPLSKKSLDVLNSIDLESMLDANTLQMVNEQITPRVINLGPDGGDGPTLGPDDGPIIPIPRPQPSGPNPFPIDPYGPYAGYGTASIIIAVAIGVVLAKNTDRTLGPQIRDFSGLERL